MGKLVAKVVLTGGPCAGKTSALTTLEEKFTEQGYKVFIIGESATELIKSGIRPFGENPLDIVLFQEIILKYQLEKEKIYEEAISKYPDDVKCIIFYDRGMLDNKAYINQKIFTDILNKNNLNELQLMDKYDMVLHLVTAADGAEKAYTLGNNSARTEGIEEARMLDKKTLDAWAGHPNIVIIDNSSDFETKLHKVLNSVNNLLGLPVSIKSQRKFLVDLKNSNLEFLTEDVSTNILIEQYYFNDSAYEKRLRVRDYNGEKTYYLTLQIKEKNGNSKVISNRKISQKEYETILATNSDYTYIRKNRYSFSFDKKYYRLDVFNDKDNLAILEVEPTLDDYRISFPKGLKIVEDVTNNPLYSNFELSKKNEVPKIYLKH